MMTWRSSLAWVLAGVSILLGGASDLLDGIGYRLEAADRRERDRRQILEARKLDPSIGGNAWRD